MIPENRFTDSLYFILTIVAIVVIIGVCVFISIGASMAAEEGLNWTIDFWENVFP